MLFFKSKNFDFLHATLKSSGVFSLSIGQAIAFDLATGEIIDAPEQSPLAVFDAVVQNYGLDAVLDECAPKFRGELLALGSCYRPQDLTTQPVSARISVGALDKQLAVFGDRNFSSTGGLSKPQAFDSMPIIPDRAFNPLLKMGTPPNVEYPGQLILSASDESVPAGFWPLSSQDLRRADLLGEFNETWLANRWPHLPDDTNPGYFNLAPADQQLSAGFFKGGEPIRLLNMHPDFPLIESKLPELRPRIFVEKQVADNNYQFVELKVDIDTLWLLPDAMTGVLIARAQCPLADSAARDINAVYADVEWTRDAPAPLDTHFNNFLIAAGRKTPEPPETISPEVDAGGQPAAGVIPEVSAVLATASAQGAESSASAAVSPAEKVLVDAIEKDIGEMDRVIQQFKDAMPKDLPEKEINEMIKNSVGNMPKTLDEARALIKQSQEQLASFLQQPGTSEKDLIAALSSEPNLKGYADALLNTPGGIAGIFKSFETSFDEMAAAQEKVGEALLQEAQEKKIVEEEAEVAVPETPTYTREWVIAEYTRGTSFEDLDLSGLDLSELKLDGAIFKQANLSTCNFKNSSLLGARFDDATAVEACFVGMKAEGANFRSASVSGSDFSSASMVSTLLELADFSKCKLTGANLSQAILSRATMNNATMTDIVAAGIVADETSFIEANLSSANLAGGRFKSANFYGATMVGANLSGAYCIQAEFSAANLSGSQISGAILCDSQANLGANLSQTNLYKSDLSGSNWEGVVLDGAILDLCRMDDVDFSKASMKKCRMINGVAKRGIFDKTLIVDADFSGLNALEGAFRGASIQNSKLEVGNYFAVDFQDAVLDRVSMEGSNILRTILAIRQDAK